MKGYPEIIYFFGRFHLLILHLPIGILVLAFLLEWYKRFRGKQELETAINLALFWGMCSAVLSAMLGFLLSLEGSFDSDALFWHQWLGFGVAGSSIVLYTFHRRKHRFYFPVFLLTLFLLGLTGHQGGNLTHGSHFLTEHRPKSLSSWLAWPAANFANRVIWTDSTQVYASMIQPILDKKCVGCHQANKQKGGLILAHKESILKGGDSGKILLAGNATQSLLIQRIELALEEKEHMPPRGKKQLEAEEITLLKWWINQGASFENRLADFEQPEKIKTLIERQRQESSGIYALDIPFASAHQLAALQSEGIDLSPIAENSPFLQVNLSDKKDINQDLLKKLQKFAPQIISLDLGNSNVTDDLTSTLKKFPHLLRLYLDQTAITDRALKNIAQLNYLEYLNLYQTQVSDKGLEQLHDLSQLKSLFLWQTACSPKGIADLKQNIPDLSIINSTQKDSLFKSVRLRPPSFTSSKTVFKDSLSVFLKSNFNGIDVHYTLDGSDPDTSSMLYQDSILISKSLVFKAVATKKDWTDSEPIERLFIQILHLAEKVSWNHPPSDKYPGEGVISASDLKKGGNSVTSKNWLGWEGKNVNLTLDYGKPIPMEKIYVGYMNNTNAWVFAPLGLEVWTSTNGQSYQKVIAKTYPKQTDPSALERLNLIETFPKREVRFVKLTVKGQLRNPSWHSNPGEPSWLFLDEVSVE